MGALAGGALMSDTLGARIFDAAADYDIYVESGYGAGDRLRALCDRADAAERLAVAAVRRDLASQEWYRHSWLGSEAKGAAKDAADAEYNQALAAWRALGGVRS